MSKRKSVASGSRKSTTGKRQSTSGKRQSTTGKRKSTTGKGAPPKPKSGGSVSKVGGPVTKRPELGAEPWIKDLADKALCDDQWRCNTGILEELHADHAGLVDLLNEKSRRGNRWPVQVISMDVIKERVMNHCAKGPDWTPFNALCEEIKNVAGRNFENEIPTDLLAHMIKYIMLDFRRIDSDRTAALLAESEEAVDRYESFEQMSETGRLVERDSFRELWASGDKRKSRQSAGKGKGAGKRQSSAGGKRKSTGGKRQSTGGKRQSTGGKRQSTGGKRQSTGGKRQSTGGKRQSTGGKRQSTGGKRQSTGGKRKSTGGKRQSTGGKRQSTGGKRQSMKRKSTGGQKSAGGGKKPPAGEAKPGRKRAEKSGSLMIVDTRLNRREVPPSDVNYKEDHPLKGPQAYFVLTQMHDPNLMLTLRNLGVPISGMFLLNKTPPQAPNEDIKDQFDSFRLQTTQDHFQRISDGRKKFDFNSKFNLAEKRAQNFWTKFLAISNHPEHTEGFANIINSIYTPQLSKVNPLRLREETGSLLYDDMSHIMFTIHRLQELYNFYLANARIVDTSDRRRLTEEDFSIYKSILDALPQESYDIAMILDAILAQVEFSTEGTLPFSLEKYGWTEVKKVNESKLSPLEDKLLELELLHDLLNEDVVDKSLKELTAVRAVHFGDLNKYASLHLGKMGKFVRHREDAVYEAFIQKRCRDVFGRDRASDVHKFHRDKLEEAVGTREQSLIAEWFLSGANLAVTNKSHRWFGGEEYIFSKCGPEPAALTLDEIEASNRGLTGEPRCTTSECVSMQRLSDEKDLNSISEYLTRLNNFTVLPKHVLRQQLCRAMNDHDVIEQDYDSVADASLFKCFNCFSTKIYEPHLLTPMSLKEFHAYIIREKRPWCNYWLNEIASQDIPKFFKTQLERLRWDAEHYATPSVISEERTVLRWDFAEPYSFKEKFIRESKPVALPVDEPLQPRPHSAIAEGDLYYLDGRGFNVKIVKKSFLFNGGSRIALTYDDSVLTKSKVSFKVTLNKCSLISNASLFPNTDPVKFHYELENGIIFSFSEIKRTVREVIQPEVLREESELPEIEVTSSATEAQPEEETLETDWKPSLIKLMEWDFYELPKPDGLWQAVMYPKYVTPVESVVEIVREIPPPPPRRQIFVLNPFDRESVDSSVDKHDRTPEIHLDLQISWPNGLHIVILTAPREEFEEVRYVKQMYLGKTDWMPLINNEKYRCILNNGTVVKFLRDDKYEILYPWGTWIACDALLPDLMLHEVLSEEEEEEGVNPDFFKTCRSQFIPSCKVTQSTGEVWSHSYRNGSKIEFNEDQMLQVDNFFCRSAEITRSDGTKFTWREDATLIVRFPDGTEIRTECWASGKEYFTEWTEEELQTWFFPQMEENEGESEEEEEEEEEESPEIDLLSLGFIVVNCARAVYHPNYAAVRCGCSKQEVLTLSMPGNVDLFIGPNGEYTVTSGFQKETRLKVTRNHCYFDRLVNSRLNQRSVMNFPLYTPSLSFPHLLKFLDSDFSEFHLDFLGNIHSRVPRNSDPNRFAKTRLGDFLAFSVRRDHSGLEIFDKDRVKHAVKRALQLGGTMKRSRAAIVTRTLTLAPLDTASFYWVMDYPPYARKCRFYSLPSTYGDSWLFPLKKKRSPKNKLDKVILINNIKTVEISNFKQFFSETMASYYKKLEETRPACSCNLEYLQDKISGRNDADLCQYFYFKPSSNEQIMNGKYFKSWIHDIFIPHVLKLMTIKFNLTQILKGMRANMKMCYHKKVPPYFESPKGAIFCIVEEIMKRVDTVIHRVNRWCSIDSVLDTPMSQLTDDHIQDLVLCVNPKKENLGSLAPEQFRLVLEAARELHEYFPTMRHALAYRREAFLEASTSGSPRPVAASEDSLEPLDEYTDWMTPASKIKASLSEGVKFQKVVQEVLGEQMKITSDDDWLKSLDRCRIAISRAAKSARRETLDEKIQEFFMPPFKYKHQVESTIKDLFRIIINHILDPDWEAKIHADELPKNEFQE